MKRTIFILPILFILTINVYSQDNTGESDEARLQKLMQPEQMTPQEAKEAYKYTSQGYTYLRGRDNQAVMEAAKAAERQETMSSIWNVLKWVIGIPVGLFLLLMASGASMPRREGRDPF